MRGPRRCLEHDPDPRSIKFGGEFINLHRVHERTGYAMGHLSLIFSKGRNPSVSCARKIASALGMTTDDFFVALDSRQRKHPAAA